MECTSDAIDVFCGAYFALQKFHVHFAVCVFLFVVSKMLYFCRLRHCLLLFKQNRYVHSCIHTWHMNAWSLQYEKCFTFWNFTCNNSHSQLTQSVYIFCRSLGVCFTFYFSKRIFSLLQIQFSLSFLMFSFVPNAIHCRCGLLCVLSSMYMWPMSFSHRIHGYSCDVWCWK